MTARVSGLLASVATAIACNGCIKIEKFRGGVDDGGLDSDGGSGSDGSVVATPVTVTKDGTGKITVGIQGLYSMEFPATGYHFPNVLTVGGTEVLAPTSASCGNETGVGVTYYPAGVFNGASGNSFVEELKSDIKIIQSGPAIVKIQLDWEAEFDSIGACAGTRPRGRSTFSFFPNGRIQRMDAAFLNQEAMISDCGCASDNHWEVATYYTFDEQYVTMFDGIPAGMSRPPTSSVGAGVDLEPSVCWNGPSNHNIAMAWRAQSHRRMRRITSTSLAMVGHMIPYAVDSSLTPVTATDPIGDTSTTMWIAKGSTCAVVEGLVAPYADDKQIEVTANGVQTPFGLGQDGLYGGEQSQSAPDHSGIFPDSNTITITPRVGDGDIPPFGVWLNLDGRRTVMSVSHPYTKQAFLNDEMLENGQYLFWFPDGLAEGQTITIVAAPP